jgi:hypothetical protein
MLTFLSSATMRLMPVESMKVTLLRSSTSERKPTCSSSSR